MSSVAWYVICIVVSMLIYKSTPCFHTKQNHINLSDLNHSASNNAWAYSDETFKIQWFIEVYLQLYLEVSQTLQITVDNVTLDTLPPFSTHTQKNTKDK